MKSPTTSTSLAPMASKALVTLTHSLLLCRPSEQPHSANQKRIFEVKLGHHLQHGNHSSKPLPLSEPEQKAEPVQVFPYVQEHKQPIWEYITVESASALLGRESRE